ncbi:MAG TPA: radical SAM protein, partial [Burkholderiaceae bacterium]|nr:radical SAM protein [Burkholderiaceae bacterium]
MGGSNVAAQDDKTPVLSDELLRRMDVPGPRYTSYPTADRFVEAFGPNEYVQALTQRASGGVSGGPLSLYLHVPFCESVCYYCACNKIVTKDHGRAQAYLEALTHELDLVTDVIGRDQPVSQLHFGGGTPTFLSDAELSGLMATLRSRVQMLPRGEYSIEIDPRTVTHERLAHLAELGFNRLSFGVQDFDAEVQKAVHRI